MDLENNSISELPQTIFDQLTQFNWLNLENNSISELPTGIFDQLAQLFILRLSNNLIRILPPGIFDQLTQLEYLSLFNNSISEVPTGIFDRLTRLESLYLKNNSFPDYLNKNFTDSGKILDVLKKAKREEAKCKEADLLEKQRISIFQEMTKSSIFGGVGKVIHLDLAEEWEISPKDANRFMKKLIRESKIQIEKLEGELTREYSEVNQAYRIEFK